MPPSTRRVWSTGAATCSTPRPPASTVVRCRYVCPSTTTSVVSCFRGVPVAARARVASVTGSASGAPTSGTTVPSGVTRCTTTCMSEHRGSSHDRPPPPDVCPSPE